MKISKLKLAAGLIITLLSIYLALPNFISSSYIIGSKVNLGLDLKGGSHLLLEVDYKTYLRDQIRIITDNIRQELRKEKIGYKNLKNRGEYISIQNRDEFQSDNFKKALSRICPNLIISSSNGVYKISYNNDAKNDLFSKLIDQSIEIVRMRIDSSGTKEPIIQRQGDKYILLQVPGEQDPGKLKKLLGKTAKLTFHLVDEDASYDSIKNGKVSLGSKIVNSGDGSNNKIAIYSKVLMSGDMLADASTTFKDSTPVVSFSFGPLGSKLFAEITKNNHGRRLAIILDNKLLSAPVINEPILGGSGIIQGNFTVESASELSLLLRAGALPAPLLVVEEKTIGPSLGIDSIEKSKKAGMIGFMSVVVFMILTYGIYGLFASFALFLALIYILALLSFFEATLTLPGIAGIILTIGMAVDANVLIYERIREEVKRKNSLVYAIHVGFESAFTTILDSNITTLIAAFLLYILGTGAIKGFSVTLSIGIVASMFASIVITKLFIDSWILFKKPKSLNI